MPNASSSLSKGYRVVGLTHMRCAIVHYHELALKGRNRDYFEQSLVRNIRTALKDVGIRQVENLLGKIAFDVDLLH